MHSRSDLGCIRPCEPPVRRPCSNGFGTPVGLEKLYLSHRELPPRASADTGNARRMRIAFYAPLKPPDHPVPSGDRRVAQLFFRALRLAGHVPTLASRFRSYEGDGDTLRQSQLAVFGHQLADWLLHRYRE